MYNLEFKEENVYTLKTLPAEENEKIIYIFRDTSRDGNGQWTIHRILYIGKSIDSDGRLNSSHEKIEPAKMLLQKDHFLTFTYHKFNGNTSDETIKAIENALIFENQPPLNKQNKDVYHFEKYGDITIHCSGHRSSLLKKDIVLRK